MRLSFQNQTGNAIAGAGRRHLTFTGPGRARTAQFCQSVLRARGWEPCREPEAPADTLIVTGIDELTAESLRQLDYRFNRAVPYALLNLDDPRISSCFASHRVPFITFGRAPEAHVRCASVRRDESGTTVRVETPLGQQDIFVPVLAVDCETSVLAAVALGLALRAELEMIASALGTVSSDAAGFSNAA